MMNYKTSNNGVDEKHCPYCGQVVKLKRIDKHYISHELLHLLHFEKGFFYTVKELMVRPGESIREFITENRNKHMKPVPFLILTSLLYTLITHLVHAEEINNGKEKINVGHTATNILHWVQAHYGYANIMMGIFIACCVKLFFKKYPYNFFENMILLCFVMGQGMLLLTVVSCFVSLVNYNVYTLLVSAVAFIYPVWAIGQFFDKTKKLGYVKAFLAYLSGYLLFYIAIIVIGLAIDLIIKIF